MDRRCPRPVHDSSPDHSEIEHVASLLTSFLASRIALRRFEAFFEPEPTRDVQRLDGDRQ
jgi:hypothetical protein